MTSRISRPALWGLLFAVVLGVVLIVVFLGGRGGDNTDVAVVSATNAAPETASPAPVTATTSPADPMAAPPSPTASVPTATAVPAPEVVIPAEPTASPIEPAPADPPSVETPLTVSAAVDPAGDSNGVPARLSIPELAIDVPVTEMGWRVVDTANGQVSEWVIPENEAGHHINSAALGQGGNLVISGHNNIYGRVFLNISRAWNDDARVQVDDATDRSDALNGKALVLFGPDGRQYDYQIEEFYRLRDTGVPVEQRVENARYMLPTDDERVTIITCWPPWNNTHRLVLIARPAAQP